MKTLKGFCWTGLLVACLLMVACSDDGQQEVKCFTDPDCPDGQQCVAGNCQLRPDGGVTTCQDINECNIGQWCNNGICEDIPDEPDAGPEDGDDDQGDDNGGDGDEGPADNPADLGPDEDLRDYSNLNFSIAVVRGGTSGPATQCIDSLRPPPNSGPVLDAATAEAGYTLSGVFRDAGGAPLPAAKVSLLASRSACLPATLTTDGGGSFTFYLPPGGPYNVQAVAADGRVGNLRVSNLSANTNQDIQLPATEDLHGGPLCTDCGAGNEVIVTGWNVEAWYRDGPNANKLAHAGVIAQQAGFDIPLENGRSYDWIAAPAAGGQLMPRQIVLDDTCHLGTACSNASNPDREYLRVRPGNSLSGTASVGATGAPQSLVSVKNDLDARFEQSVAAGTGGSYQMQLSIGSWNIIALPAGNGFDAGAMMFASPAITIYADTSKDTPMAIGQQITFNGRIVDGGGGGVGDAQVVLIVNDTPLVEGSYAWCDPNPVATSGDGSFSARCNLAP